MPISVTTTSPDRAVEALAAAVAAAKGGDVLERVVVAVPTNTAGVMARRALGRQGGVVGIDMVTLDRLAELIAGPALAAADRSPVSTPVIDLAVAAVLAAGPGSYAPVADHPSTIVALREVHRELRRAGAAAADALAARSARGREVVRVSRAVTARLADRWYDEADLFVEATRMVGSDLPDDLAHLVVFLPTDLRGLPLAFTRRLGSHLDVRLVVALTGVVEADADAIALLDALDARPVEPPPAVTAAPDRIVSVTDADDEVRVAMRIVLDAARAGTPFERMAIVWPNERPYARLVEHHLTAAELPWNGRPGTATRERLAPRLVLDLLDVDRRGLRRRDLFAMLADVPARDAHGAYLPTAEWERVSRYAGVARDDDWHRRLGGLAGHTRWGSPATALMSFVAELRATLGDPAATSRWWDWATWCTDQLERWVGRQALTGRPEAEYRGWDTLTMALDRLRHLDHVGPPVTRAQFRTTLEAELDDMPGREGRVGNGVTVGPLLGAPWLDVDLAVVLGGAEGVLPPTPSADPLLTDDDRAAAGLPPAGARAERLHRNLLGLLATSAVTVTIPRGDLRATTDNHPSRWVDPWLDNPRLHVVASQAAGLAATEFPASVGEHRLRARFGHVMAGNEVDSAPGAAGDHVLARGIALRRARRSDRLTEFDGDLTAVGVPILDSTVSPSQLETWVACPYAYFVRYLLEARPIEEPADEISITPRDRGTAAHAALDRFHRAVIAGDLPQPTASGWSAVHRAALGRFFDEVSAETERRGRTGRPAYWAVEHDRIRGDLLGWLDHDSEVVSARGATVLASEHRFGEGSGAAFELPGGRRLPLDGSIDRIDRCADGTLAVTDHKTGDARRYRGLSADDPTLEGKVFQLPSYAVAALALTGEPDTVVHAEYGLLEKGGYKRLGFAVTPQVLEHVQAAVAAVVDGIESGLFPAKPDRPGWRPFVGCEYCEPDHLGTGERWPEWERKRHDPRLARWFAAPDDATDTADAAADTSLTDDTGDGDEQAAGAVDR